MKRFPTSVVIREMHTELTYKMPKILKAWHDKCGKDMEHHYNKNITGFSQTRC